MSQVLQGLKLAQNIEIFLLQNFQNLLIFIALI